MAQNPLNPSILALENRKFGKTSNIAHLDGERPFVKDPYLAADWRAIIEASKKSNSAASELSLSYLSPQAPLDPSKNGGHGGPGGKHS